MAQDVVPAFKSQQCKKEKKKRNSKRTKSKALSYFKLESSNRKGGREKNKI
jgi:hypothetical protein